MKPITEGANVKAVVSVPQAVLFCLKFLKVKGKKTCTKKGKKEGTYWRCLWAAI